MRTEDAIEAGGRGAAPNSMAAAGGVGHVACVDDVDSNVAADPRRELVSDHGRLRCQVAAGEIADNRP